MNYGFVKVAAITPKTAVADVSANAAEIIRLAREAADMGVRLAVFPELSVTGATCGDMFLMPTLINAAADALFLIAAETADLDCVFVLGAPIKREGKLYNCAVTVYRGDILGIVPKNIISARSELHEAGVFTPAPKKCGTAELGGIAYPFGVNMLFYCESLHEFNFSAVLGNEIFGLEPVSASHARAGATVICSLSASMELAGREERRLDFTKTHSERLTCGLIYADADKGESTTDGVFGGQRIICENGDVLAFEAPFSSERITVTDIDVSMLSATRMKDDTFVPTEVTADNYYAISFDMELSETILTRKFPRLPFVPAEEVRRNARCERILSVQANGLAKRIEHTGAKRAVIGISGGLDSCLALMVSTMAMDALGRPHSDVLAVTMPCFGTTERTRTNAESLCRLLGVTFRCIDIKEAVSLHFRDIGHDEKKHDVVYENVQARERTQIIMDIANAEGGIVIGTGDLSELTLGWATYNGDLMSMYSVNSSVPKTLIPHLIGCFAKKCGNEALSAVLSDIVATPVSPELLPADEKGGISQKTEDIVGPYMLHDFFMYYFLRHGYSPEKILHLAAITFEGEYDGETIRGWLSVFMRRFFSQQFKRSCLPDGVKVGSVAISPRGDLRMPSDAVGDLWRM